MHVEKKCCHIQDDPEDNSWMTVDEVIEAAMEDGKLYSPRKK